MSMYDPLATYNSAAREADLQRRVQADERRGRWAMPRGRSRSTANLDDLLLAAQKSWLAALSEALGAIDSDAPLGREAATLQAYVATRTRLPGPVALLSEHEGHPAIALGSSLEYRMVARAAAVADATLLVAQARAAAGGLNQESTVQPAEVFAPAMASPMRIPRQHQPVFARMAGVLQRVGR